MQIKQIKYCNSGEIKGLQKFTHFEKIIFYIFDNQLIEFKLI